LGTDRVERVIAHYEGQSESDAVAEDEGAFQGADETTMTVPRDLVPAVRELIARRSA
jgi:type II secretory pathway component PulC